MPSRAHLSNGGVDFIAEVIDGAFVIRYWGATIQGDIGEIQFERSIANSDYDQIQTPGFFREHSRGWLGYPTISGHRDGKDWSTHFSVTELKADKRKFESTLEDTVTKLRASFSGAIDSNGVITFQLTLTNLGERFTLNEQIGRAHV